jgi:hypothetical protein
LIGGNRGFTVRRRRGHRSYHGLVVEVYLTFVNCRLHLDSHRARIYRSIVIRFKSRNTYHYCGLICVPLLLV